MATWHHTDPYGIWARSQDALERGLSHGWLDGSPDVRGAELRAFIGRTGLAATRLAFKGQPLSPSTSIVELGDMAPEAFPSADHYRAARAMFGWVVAIGGDKRPTSDNFSTVAGLPPIGPGGQVEGWPIVVLRVLGTAIWALAACYIAERYESTIARFGDHASNTVGMMAATSTATNLVEAHNAREVQAGQSLPWSDEEKKVLDAAIAAQEKFASKPVLPPDKHSELGSGLGSMSTGAILALGAVGYFVLKGNKS